MLEAQSRQAKYYDARHRKLEFQVVLPPELGTLHDVFHVSSLRRALLWQEQHISTTEGPVAPDRTVRLEPIRIDDTTVRVLQKKKVSLEKVLWSNHGWEEHTWELRDLMLEQHPELFASKGPKEWSSIPRSKLLVENRVREQARRRGEIPWPTTATAAVGLRSRIFNGVQVRRKPPPPAAKSPPNVSPHLNGGGGGGGRPGRWPSGREMTLEGAPGRANLGPWLFGEDERMPSILL
ncbi:hypothetical protein KSP39_PZI012697 [Platanthera zijinensis]|uniref:Chromo domain-containing protein n=1 Tax=Platanthera zijinensis TaxID=2320716 RepID=A0AAP0BFH9_9ASPA